MSGFADNWRKTLQEVLVEQGVISETQLAEALRKRHRSGAMLVEILVDEEYVAEKDLAGTIALNYGWPFLDLERYDIDDDLCRTFPPGLMRQYGVIPVERIGDAMAIAAAGRVTPDIISELEDVSGKRVFVYVSTLTQVRRMLARLPDSGRPRGRSGGSSTGDDPTDP